MKKNLSADGPRAGRTARISQATFPRTERMWAAFLATVLVAGSLHYIVGTRAVWAATCASGTLADYIALGTTGCTIQNLVFSSFSYFDDVPAGTNGSQFAPSDVSVSPVDTPGNPGLQFSAPWSGSGTYYPLVVCGSYLCSTNLYSRIDLISYRVAAISGNPEILGMSVMMDGASGTGLGSTTVGLTGDELIGGGINGSDALVTYDNAPAPYGTVLAASVIFGQPAPVPPSEIAGPVNALGVTASVNQSVNATLQIQNGSVSLGSFTNQFNTAAAAVFTFPPCVNGLQVDVNGAATPGDAVTSITFDWGDGQQESGFFPLSHTYSSQGQFTVQVTAAFNDGSVAQTAQIVNVAPGVLFDCLSLTISAGQGGSVSYQPVMRPSLATQDEK